MEKINELVKSKLCSPIPEIRISKEINSRVWSLEMIRESEYEKDKGNYYFVERENGKISKDFVKKRAVFFLGEKEEYSSVKLKEIINSFLSEFSRKEVQFLVKTFIREEILKTEKVINIISETILSAKYKIFSLKTKKEEKKDEPIFLITNFCEAEKIIEKNKKILSKINLVKNFQILPPNIANSVFLAKKYKELFFKNSKIKVTILGKEELEKLGFGLLLAVNKGSAFPAQFVVAEFLNNSKSNEKVALIGKGITFDSGGYSLKPSNYMTNMKFDMSGSAIVAGVVSAAAELNLNINVVALLPITDNKIDKDSCTPDSVWKSYSGKTVEINNTDAEGRLILADAITYASKNCNATEIITIATLTGAVLICLGDTFTGFWSTSCMQASMLKKAAEEAEELIWRLPFHNDFLEGFKGSSVADIFNTNFKSKAGSSNAAMFLKEFTDGKPFIHLDIAGTANKGGVPQAPLLKSLLRYLEKKFKEGGCSQTYQS